MTNFMLSPTRRMHVDIYNKKPMVSIREYYNKNGEMKPGIKGLTMMPDQFNILQSGISTIDDAITKGGEDNNPVLDLSKSRKVSVSSYRGSVLIHFREYYEKDGVTSPGKKGIALTLDQWKLVKEHMPVISKEIEQLLS